MKLTFKERNKARPGAGSYSYYHADRHLNHTTTRPGRPKLKWEILVVALLLLAVGTFMQLHGNKAAPVVSEQPKITAHKKTPAVATKPVTKVAPTPVTGKCATNTLSKSVIVSISQRHLWGCEGSTQVHDSPVITGMEKLAADLTPRGTFKVYAKVTNTVLKGSDSTGSWNDPVSYWMPYLDNQYGTYGFHDATWRNPSEFGNVDPNSDKGSHGCVEMPLSDMAWLYGWAPVGMSLTVVD